MEAEQPRVYDALWLFLIGADNEAIGARHWSRKGWGGKPFLVSAMHR